MFTRILFIGLLFCSFNSKTFSQNNTTSVNADPFCIGITYTSAAGTPGANVQEPGNDYNCLSTSPNPSWYFLKCSQSGTIDLLLSAPQDIDFIIYGPFADYASLQNNTGSLNNVLDCSYSATNMETPTIPNMSTGDYYLLLVTNYANTVQEISLTQTGGTGSLDCSVYAEGGTHLIYGQAYYDENNNGTFDNNDFGIPGVEVGIDPLAETAFSNYTGFFHFFNQTPDSINYTVDANLSNYSLTSSPASYYFGLDSTQALSDTLLFGFYPDSLYYSANADLIVNSVSCVNNNSMWINIQNDGTLPANGQITIELDSNINYSFASYPLDSQVGDILTFSYDSLYLLQNLNFQINTFPDITLAVGDTITTILTLTSLDTLNNIISIATDTIYSPVFCSYDPNFKESLPNGGMPNEIIQPEDSLEYIIHFQNTGTAPAVNVVIEDEIHNNLDLSSFKFLSASHTVDITIDTNRIVKFGFNNINLPDSNTNEPLSHGYVKFQMHPINGLLPNDSITNDVAIFFDNNPPIYTNTVVNEIDCYIKPDLSNTNYSNGFINTELTDLNLSFEWFLDGVLITGATDASFQTSSNGNYTVVVTNDYGCTSSYEVELSLGVDEDELSIFVSPNPFVNEITVFSSNSTNLKIQLINAEGKIIHSESNSSTEKIVIDGSKLSSGIYMLEVTCEDHEVIRQKLIKN